MVHPPPPPPRTPPANAGRRSISGALLKLSCCDKSSASGFRFEVHVKGLEFRVIKKSARLGNMISSR